MVVFTSDIDWAPEEAIGYMLKIFEKNRIKCTLFATHKSKVLDNCDRNLFEIALHPNFNKLLFEGKCNESPEEIVQNLINIYPEAIGIKSHSMTQSTPLLDLFKKKGLVYDANQFMPYSNGVTPFLMWNGLIRIPYNWEDDVHYLYNYSFDDPLIDITENQVLNIFNFHPAHIYINNNSEANYLNAKKYYKDPKKYLKFKLYNQKGAETILNKIIDIVIKNKIQTIHMKDIAKKILQPK